MDPRLLFTAFLLACNAGYLIWKAKTKPKDRSKAPITIDGSLPTTSVVSSEKVPVLRSSFSKPSDKLSASESDT